MRCLRFLFLHLTETLSLLRLNDIHLLLVLPGLFSAISMKNVLDPKYMFAYISVTTGTITKFRSFDANFIFDENATYYFQFYSTNITPYVFEQCTFNDRLVIKKLCIIK